MAMIRLDKYLADMGAGTRAEIKKSIRKGMVTVDGIVVNIPEAKVEITGQKVRYAGIEMTYVNQEYYMLYKPQGVVSATRDHHTQTVLDLIDSKKRKDLFPVGRLDKDTEGLLLITNDGALAHRLLSPKKHVEKIYFAKVQGRVTKEDQQLFSQGLDIGEPALTKPARLILREYLEDTDCSLIELAIVEGKYHQVKRMFEAVGKEVLYLKRLSMGTLVLDEQLKPGEYRLLTKEEKEKLC